MKQTCKSTKGVEKVFRNYKEMLDKARDLGPVSMSVAVAQDRDVLDAVKMAEDAGIVRAILVGNEDAIRSRAEEVGLRSDIEIIHEGDDSRAALKAVELVSSGKAQILMKGLVNTSVFMKAVLDKEVGLRTGRLLSHLAVFEIPGTAKLLFSSDGGINVAPLLDQKKQILVNALGALKEMGLINPKVAVLTANEKVSDKMPATVDAAALARMNNEGNIPIPCIVEGPIALDVAIDPHAAEHKGIASMVTGDVDFFLFPNIESGNIMGKTLIHYAGAKMAGIVLGTSHPVVLASRAETAEGKLNSIALAALTVQR